jgi:hypothetical protein
MKSRRGLRAALLLTAVCARAQLELRAVPALSAPAAAAPAASAAALSVFAPGAVALAAPATPALSAASPSALSAPAAEPSAFSAAAAPAAEPAARTDAMRAAVADFSRLNLGSVGADGTRAAGDALMARALGEAGERAAAAVPGAPSAPASGLSPSGRRLYLLSKPLRETVQLGPVARVAHWTGAAAWELFKAWAGWHATGHVMGGIAVLVVELPVSPAMLTGRSLLDLGARYWHRKLAVLRALARAPGVERVRVLTAGQAEFSGPLAVAKRNTGLIFVDASRAPPAGDFGAALEIADASRQTVRLTLERPDSAASVVWTPTLADLLERRPLPAEIAAAWRRALKASAPGPAPGPRLLEAAHSRDLRISAALVGGPSGDVALGALVAGPAVKTFIGLGRLDRLRARLGWSVAPRSLPLSDTTVLRAGEPVELGGASWPVRLWRRLTGRLIVVP